MDKIENGIFEYSDPKKIPSLVEIENAHRRARVAGAEKFAVLINGEYFGYNPQKRGIYKLNAGEYQALENYGEPIKEHDAATNEQTEAETPTTANSTLECVEEFVPPATIHYDNFAVPNNRQLSELLDALTVAIRDLISDCDKKDMEIAELKSQMAIDCDRYKKFANMAREMNAKIEEMLK